MLGIALNIWTNAIYGVTAAAGSAWILAAGLWNDSGEWIDTSNWID